jgi:hypothetical protein
MEEIKEEKLYEIYSHEIYLEFLKKRNKRTRENIKELKKQIKKINQKA